MLAELVAITDVAFGDLVTAGLVFDVALMVIATLGIKKKSESPK